MAAVCARHKTPPRPSCPNAPLLRDDAKSRVLEFRNDLARDVPGCSIGFDNGKGALDGHVFAFS